ncbi:glucosaminidase domain-containing protein [Vagococcus salmoninarum]|uniref:Peptidoglycan hydrolase n=1 Tax=Vagococcus salmoninarum TaxID=2739 RepID=A0A429ZBZ5_9ENTE|nr:LysM peptidoglycan-binding domain-containing protein [Vagococcus salmoninarum]RST91193.1 hypothetical protein CBF35_14665 [Vagococcus salmoninarum]
MKLNKIISSFLLCCLAIIFVINGTVGQASAQVERKEDIIFFIDQIAPKARKLAWDNDLYASVMLAQAILASDYGRSELSNDQVNNIYSMQGRYQDRYVKWSDGAIVDEATNYSEYRKYPSYNEALKDFVALMKNGTSSDPNFYSGAFRSKTVNYKEATAFLISRYAEDPEYSKRLNAIIDLYNLTDFDVKPDSDKENNFNKVHKNEALEKLNTKKVHIVTANQTLVDIADKYQIDLLSLIENNHLGTSAIVVGQELVVD